MPTLVEPLGSGDTVENRFFRTVLGVTDMPFYGGAEDLAGLGRGICRVLDESTARTRDWAIGLVLSMWVSELDWDGRTAAVVMVYSTVAFCPEHLSAIRDFAAERPNG